jgi:plasmid stabilization system protein ParE
MTELVLAPGAFDEIERLTGFLRNGGDLNATEIAVILLDGMSLLKQHPMIGGQAEEGLRELVISRGRSGYVALYRYDVVSDTALILAIRQQREGGYESA